MWMEWFQSLCQGQFHHFVLFKSLIFTFFFFFLLCQFEVLVLGPNVGLRL